MALNTESLKPLSKHYDSLDYLRGLAAFGVMSYHMSLFSFGESDASSFLARVKIYAVAIFYVLSGLTLFIANSKLEANKTSISSFYIKRFFRIFPLLWLATIITYLINSNAEFYSFKTLIVNIFVLPGMVRPDKFVANGAWSIGNEIFFYFLFPFLFLINKYKKLYFFAAISLILIAFLVFTFKILDTSITLGHQWFNYVNPFNQLLFFAAGVFLPTIKTPPNKISKWAPILMVLSLLVIIFYPITGEPIMLITGTNRIVLSLATILLCYSFYLSDFFFLSAFIKRTLKFLGDTSYSIYLLHPIIFYILKMISDKYFPLNQFVLISLTVITTLITCKLVFEKFEKRFIGYGKSIINTKLMSAKTL